MLKFVSRVEELHALLPVSELAGSALWTCVK